MPGEVKSVTLSRPALHCAQNGAQDRPGILSAGTAEAQAWTISSVWSSNLATSTPWIAAGTMPKFESAE